MAGVSLSNQSDITAHFFVWNRKLARSLFGFSPYEEAHDYNWLSASSVEYQENNTLIEMKVSILRMKIAVDKFSHNKFGKFWMADFRLPSECLKEIERLCAAFL